MVIATIFSSQCNNR